jgi:hypothetical protein
LKPDDIGDVRHVDAAFEHQPGLALAGIRLILATTDQSRFLLVRVYVLAAKQDSFKEIDVVL